MTRTIPDTGSIETDPPPDPTPARAVDTIDYEAGYQQRKRGIYVMAWSTVVFFIGAIAASYAVAIAHGYGTGFGDGREIADRVKPWSGTGFWGDFGILAGTAAIVVIALYSWYYIASRLDNFTSDDPVAPDNADVDLNEPSSWYVVQVPGLVKSLYVVAIVCLLGVVLGAAVLLPVVTIRFGFVL